MGTVLKCQHTDALRNNRAHVVLDDEPVTIRTCGECDYAAFERGQVITLESGQMVMATCLRCGLSGHVAAYHDR